MKVAFLLHGIKDRAVWMNDVQLCLKDAEIKPVPLKYGYFLALQLYFSASRDTKIEWLRKEISRRLDQLKSNGEWDPVVDGPPSIIAHSFGTYLVAKLIEKYDHFRFDKIVFCGSIVESNYNWVGKFNTGQVGAVLNQYGGQDVWAWVVKYLVEGTGSSGYFGFIDPFDNRLIQQGRHLFEHGSYFFKENYWIWGGFIGQGRAETLPFRPTNLGPPAKLFGRIVLVTFFIGICIFAAVARWAGYLWLGRDEACVSRFQDVIAKTEGRATLLIFEGGKAVVLTSEDLSTPESYSLSIDTIPTSFRNEIKKIEYRNCEFRDDGDGKLKTPKQQSGAFTVDINGRPIKRVQMYVYLKSDSESTNPLFHAFAMQGVVVDGDLRDVSELNCE